MTGEQDRPTVKPDIRLGDDGTLDTVLYCADCGAEFRFNFEPGPDEADGAAAYDAFVESAIEEIQDEHICEPEDDEPSEDDITTEDHEKFYQSGRLVLRYYPEDGTANYLPSSAPDWRLLGTFDNCEAAVRAYMEKVQFWPNVWWVSDHGNAHLMDLTDNTRASAKEWSVTCEHCSPQPFIYIGPEPVLCPRCQHANIDTTPAM